MTRGMGALSRAVGIAWRRSLQLRVVALTLGLSLAVILALGFVLTSQVTNRVLDVKVRAAIEQIERARTTVGGIVNGEETRSLDSSLQLARNTLTSKTDPASGAGRTVALGAGQRLVLDDSGVGQLSSVDPQETFSWRAGRLVYRAAPLSDVVADLNHQFVEQTTLADPELGKTPITGVIVLDNPRAVMSRLALMLPIKAVPSDKGLVLQRK